MSPCILFKKTGDSDVILLNDDLTVNLPCEQRSQKFIGQKNLLVL